jgi:hypothetical protein
MNMLGSGAKRLRPAPAELCAWGQMPAMARSKVDFPHPEWPDKITLWPGAAERLGASRSKAPSGRMTRSAFAQGL